MQNMLPRWWLALAYDAHEAVDRHAAGALRHHLAIRACVNHLAAAASPANSRKRMP